MIKLVMSWKNNPHLSAEEADRHYEEVHTKLALAMIADKPEALAYVQNRVFASMAVDFNDPATMHEEPPQFDRYMEVYFEDVESMTAAMSRVGNVDPFADHPNFMDVDTPASLRVYHVESRVIANNGVFVDG
jgi:hypothetical protein